MSSAPSPASPHALLLAVQDLLSREIALDDLVRMLVDQMVAGLHADRGTLYLLDPVRQELFSKAAHLPELKEIRLRVGQGLAGHVAASGEPLNVRSTRDELRFFGGIDQQTGYTSRSLMAVPLRDRRGRIFGVVQVLNKKGGAFPATISPPSSCSPNKLPKPSKPRACTRSCGELKAIQLGASPTIITG